MILLIKYRDYANVNSANTNLLSNAKTNDIDDLDDISNVSKKDIENEAKEVTKIF